MSFSMLFLSDSFFWTKRIFFTVQSHQLQAISMLLLYLLQQSSHEVMAMIGKLATS